MINMIEKNGKFIVIGEFVLRIKDVQAVFFVEEKGNPYIKIVMRGSNYVYNSPCSKEEAKPCIDKILYLLNDD